MDKLLEIVSGWYGFWQFIFLGCLCALVANTLNALVGQLRIVCRGYESKADKEPKAKTQAARVAFITGYCAPLRFTVNQAESLKRLITANTVTENDLPSRNIDLNEDLPR